MSAFQTLPQVGEVLQAGASKSAIRLHTGEQVDLRVVEPKHWGCALQYFTGSKQHNIQMRRLAQQAGLSLNEYRFLALEGSGEEFYCPTEAEVYQKLDLPWIAPELREDQGEIVAATEGDLPELLVADHLRGDLHMHSTWSDGKASILEMAQAARALDLQYIVITDHSQSLAMKGGLTVERLIEQRYEIINVNSQFDDFTVLQGAEVEIKADGSLDYPDEILSKLDVVIASMHTGIRGEREALTNRMLKAIHNPHVDIIGHLTNRLLGRREGANLDIDAILHAAAETGTILEINSQPDRLDLSPAHARQALEYGCLLAINSDAHTTEGLHNSRYGIMQARRAWAEADDIINTRSLEEFLSYIEQKGDFL
jgi:DNA polymerase (family 10)